MNYSGGKATRVPSRLTAVSLSNRTVTDAVTFDSDI